MHSRHEFDEVRPELCGRRKPTPEFLMKSFITLRPEMRNAGRRLLYSWQSEGETYACWIEFKQHGRSVILRQPSGGIYGELPRPSAMPGGLGIGLTFFKDRWKKNLMHLHCSRFLPVLPMNKGASVSQSFEVLSGKTP